MADPVLPDLVAGPGLVVLTGRDLAVRDVDTVVLCRLWRLLSWYPGLAL